MTHDELLAICDNYSFKDSAEPVKALRAVVELHKPFLSNKFYAETLNAEPDIICQDCTAFQHRVKYPCRTIQAIEKELNG